jgi:hypothetical protein
MTLISHQKNEKELMNSEQLGVLEWKDFPSDYEEASNVNVHFTFDEATRSAWKSAKEEITSILINARKEDPLNLSETEKPSTEKILSLFFGKESRFAKGLILNLQFDYKTLTLWLHDICLQAINQLSPTDKVFENPLLLSYTENTFIWKKLSHANQPSNSVIAWVTEETFYTKIWNLNTIRLAETS